MLKTNLTHILFISYWGTVLIYYLYDNYIYHQNIWNQFKLQPYHPNVWKCWLYDTYSSFINTLVTYCCFYLLPIHYTSYYLSLYDIYKFICYIICVDLYFYTTHRYCHKNLWLYRRIHKHHHTTHITVASSGFSASIIEHLIINIGSVYIPHLFIRGSYQLLCIIVCIGGYSSASSHSGYKISYSHNIHHQLLQYNYGNGLYIWDRIFGTFKP